MGEIMMRYTIAGQRGAKDVATAEYRLERGEEGGGVMLLILERVGFLEGATEEFEAEVLRHVGTHLWWRKGMEIEQLWPGWSKAGYRVKDVTECDVSFERFWAVYGNKVGNKAGAAKKWEKLSWEERVLAIGCVPRLRRYYEQKGLQLPYPETYINQRRWENEFDG